MIMYWASSNQMNNFAARKTMKLLHGELYTSQFLNISYPSAWREGGGKEVSKCLAVQFNEDAIALGFFFIAV